MRTKQAASLHFSLNIEVVKMSSPNLPEEFLFEIFARLPAKDVARCKCLSKFWKTNLSTSRFIDLHLIRRDAHLKKVNIIAKKMLADAINKLNKINRPFHFNSETSLPSSMASVASSSNSVSDPLQQPKQDQQQQQQPNHHVHHQEATGESSMAVKIESTSVEEDVSTKQPEPKRLKTESQQEISNVAKPEVVEASDDKGIVSSEDEVDKFKKDQIEKFKEEQCEKLKKYEADYKQYLISKYFSDKTIFGGNIFDVKMNADGGTIRSSRLPVYQSYLDPVTFHGLLDGKESVSSAETATVAVNSNGKASTEGN